MRLLFLVSVLTIAACSIARHTFSEDEGNVTKGIDEIQASFDDPQAINRIIAGATDDARWQLLFAYGETSGTRLDLVAASERTALLPDEESRWHFWDGYAHAAPWPGDDPAVHVARIRMLSGQRVHSALEDGVLLRFAQNHADDPQAIVEYAARWSALTGRAPNNGVRIGLQRALGDDMPKAISRASELPVEWQPDLYEELGWRVGMDPARARELTLSLMTTVPEPSRCSFVHGSVRGHALHVSLDDGMTLARDLSKDCETEAWKAVGWTVHQLHPYDPQIAEQLGASLGETQRVALLAGYREQEPM